MPFFIFIVSMDMVYTLRGIPLGNLQKEKLSQRKEGTIYSEHATFLAMEGENK